MSNFELPIPLSEIESVLAWVDTFKLSRVTKKINRDFSDAVLLAEILNVHYPKLVEMHNYPPRNGHALKLNNWMTLNRKVLKKLKLNLCCNTMEQLVNCTPGIIERVLIMVRDKIRRDEELNKSIKDAEQNVSSGGSYYEACGDDELVLIVPVKMRVNGVLETMQQKVISYDTYVTQKVELKDLKDSNEVLRQKVKHLDNLIKIKDERIEELQKQLERKQTRRKEVEALQNSLGVPIDTTLSLSPKVSDVLINAPNKTAPIKSIDSTSSTKAKEESKIPVPKVESTVPIKIMHSKPTEVAPLDVQNDFKCDVDRIKSDVFREIEIVEQKSERFHDVEDFKDSEQGVITIEDTIRKEITDIVKPMYEQDHNVSYIN